MFCNRGQLSRTKQGTIRKGKNPFLADGQSIAKGKKIGPTADKRIRDAPASNVKSSTKTASSQL